MSSLTGDRGFVGTIDYVPPEQIAGGAIDRRADVYSLGCVLFECLAGARPFERERALGRVRPSERAAATALRLQAGPAASIRRRLRHCIGQVAGRALRHLRGLVAAARAALRGEGSARPGRSRRRLYALVGAALIVAAAAIAGFVLARDEATPSAVSISQTSIAGATLGRNEEAYKELYGLGWRADVVTVPGFPVLIYAHRRQAIYFDPDTRRSNIVTTWNRDHKTAAGSARARASRSSSPPTGAR